MKEIIDRMRSVIEAPEYRFLTHYKSDFYKCDVDYLNRTEAPGSRYLWVVRETGTHLVRLGVHPKIHEEGTAALHVCAPAKREVYLVDDKGLTRINDERATQLLKQLDYHVSNGVVYKGRVAIASFTVETSRWSIGKPPAGTVRFAALQQYLALETLVALRQIAESEVVVATQSLFTRTESATLDGVDLFDMIQAQQKSLHESPELAQVP
jgi:hypothetical protein